MKVFLSIETSQPCGASYRLAVGGLRTLETGFDYGRTSAVVLTVKASGKPGAFFFSALDT